MYQVEVKVKGLSVLLQHRFPVPTYEEMGVGGKKQTGSKNYQQEWRESLYASEKGEIYQPANHFELSMVKAATNFKITGRRGKTYKDLVAANVVIDPERIPFGITVTENDDLTTDADQPLYLDLRPVVVNRGRIPRIRPAFKPGWELEFVINVLDDELPATMLQDILVLAGKTVGVGDYRPKFGRFAVVKFEVAK
jgi:hypothetical protein